jgi:PadR family transcriptional regulator, regulatory protein PadR
MLAVHVYFFYIHEVIAWEARVLTNLEELVLLAVKALGGDAYGVSVQDMLERAGQPTSIGVVYATLERLEAKRYTKSLLGEATAARGGRRKRLFEPTRSGLHALATTHATRAQLRLAAGLGRS